MSRTKSGYNTKAARDFAFLFCPINISNLLKEFKLEGVIFKDKDRKIRCNIRHLKCSTVRAPSITDFIKTKACGNKKCKFEKISITCLEKYGVDHHLKSKEVQQKRKDTNVERYGVENQFQTERNRRISIENGKNRLHTPELVEQARIQMRNVVMSNEYKRHMVEIGEWKSEEDKTEWEKYSESVRRLTQENFTKFFYEIPNARERGKRLHLDHRLSLFDGFRNNISVEIVAHYKNFQMLTINENSSKNKKSDITLEELMTLIASSKDPL